MLLQSQPDPDSYLAEYEKKINAIERLQKEEKYKRDQEEIRTEKKQIKQIIDDRHIKHLIHFTRLENLSSILKYGLVPISLQEKYGIKSIRNDISRLEGREYCTSCSVEFPNYQMFYKYEKNNPDSKWVVLVLDVNILLVDNRVIYFSYTNAARAHQKHNRIYHRFQSHKEFENMFAQNFKFSREEQLLPDSMPTDPQAEILIKDIIDPHFIERICFNNQNDLSRYLTHRGIIDEETKKRTCVDPTFFKPRIDYHFWSKEKSNGI